MNGYFFAVFAASAVLGVLGMITYKENSSVEKAAIAIIILYTVAAPIADTVSRGKNELFEEFRLESIDVTDGGYIQVAKDAFEEGIQRAVADRYSIKKENVSVRAVDFDFSEMKAGKIRILLTGLGVISDTRGIEKYVSSLGVGECEVDIEI